MTVTHGRTGFLVDSRRPAEYATAIVRILDDADLARRFAADGAATASRYRWSTTAARLRRLYADLSARTLVSCA